MIFRLNKCPSNGSCLIIPLNGSLFTISCIDWVDEDQIKDYTIYCSISEFQRFDFVFFCILVWIDDYSKQTIIGFSLVPIFEVRLPFVNEEMNLMVKIRDKYHCQSEKNLTKIRIENDFDLLNHLIYSKYQLIFNQNQLNQIISSLSRQLNTTFEDSLDEMKIYTNFREYLINLMMKQMFIPYLNLIELQISTIVQLTQVTNQLTLVKNFFSISFSHFLLDEYC